MCRYRRHLDYSAQETAKPHFSSICHPSHTEVPDKTEWQIMFTNMRFDYYSHWAAHSYFRTSNFDLRTPRVTKSKIWDFIHSIFSTLACLTWQKKKTNKQRAPRVRFTQKCRYNSYIVGFSFSLSTSLFLLNNNLYVNCVRCWLVNEIRAFIIIIIIKKIKKSTTTRGQCIQTRQILLCATLSFWWRVSYKLLHYK